MTFIDYDNYLYPDYLEKMMSSSITLKPYLRPMRSMTDEEFGFLLDYLNKRHFNYRGLIEKGLAIDATGLNIY